MSGGSAGAGYRDERDEFGENDPNAPHESTPHERVAADDRPRARLVDGTPSDCDGCGVRDRTATGIRWESWAERYYCHACATVLFTSLGEVLGALSARERAKKR